jgi:hypothetical protein
MRKAQVAVVALLLGVAAVLGVLAATRTAGVGAAARSNVTSATVAARAHRLDRLELALRRALRDRPPALPQVPTSSPRPAAAPHVVYRRPAPIVVLKDNPRHDDEGEMGTETGDD